MKLLKNRVVADLKDIDFRNSVNLVVNNRIEWPARKNLPQFVLRYKVLN